MQRERASSESTERLQTHADCCFVALQGIESELRTYNIVITAYNMSRQASRSSEVVADCWFVTLQGIEPEIRTYNTVIIACNMSGQAQEALKVYERMLTAGAQPTATTYTALISAYGKNGQLDRALQIFEDMVGPLGIFFVPLGCWLDWMQFQHTLDAVFVVPVAS